VSIGPINNEPNGNPRCVNKEWALCPEYTAISSVISDQFPAPRRLCHGSIDVLKLQIMPDQSTAFCDYNLRAVFRNAW
jgi:hypothetical protein